MKPDADVLSAIEQADAEDAETKDASVAREQAARARAKAQGLETALRRVTKERDEAHRRLDLVGRLEAGELKPPKWAQPRKRTKGAYHGTVNLMLSDTHFDEVVEPAQIDFYNAYNREIAERRLRYTVDSAVRLATEFFTGLTYDGAVLLMGGDIFSGIIHQELLETNEAPILASVLYWEERIAAAVEVMASAFGKLHVPCTYGNHGRRTLKPIAKMRAQDSFEWLLYHNVARHFAGSKAVTWAIPDSPDVLFRVYNHTTLLTHGDQFKGGSGIAGAVSPLLLGTHRKTRRNMALGRPYDLMAIGHFHQYMSLPGKGLLVNGAMKGYDEYAYQHNFEAEPAQQALWITTPEHGVTFSAPVICQDRVAEGW